MIITYKKDEDFDIRGSITRDTCMRILFNPKKTNDLIYEYHDCDNVVELKAKFISEMSKKFDEAVLNSFSVCEEYSSSELNLYKDCK